MEYANSGDLSYRIKRIREKDQMFREEVILKILTQMCLGIQALHALRIMHRDLKVTGSPKERPSDSVPVGKYFPLGRRHREGGRLKR